MGRSENRAGYAGKHSSKEPFFKPGFRKTVNAVVAGSLLLGPVAGSVPSASADTTAPTGISCMQPDAGTNRPIVAVLGSAGWEGYLSMKQKKRIEAGAVIFAKEQLTPGMNPKIALVDGEVDLPAKGESYLKKVYKRFTHKRLRDRDLVVDSQSYDTISNMTRLKKIMRDTKSSEAIVVTSEDHLPRAMNDAWAQDICAVGKVAEDYLPNTRAFGQLEDRIDGTWSPQEEKANREILERILSGMFPFVGPNSLDTIPVFPFKEREAELLVQPVTF